MLRLALPNDGPLHETALQFLLACGVGVFRTNLRRYEAEIPALPGVTVHFQRGAEIVPKVEEGSADMGIVGQDRFQETRSKNGNSSIIIDDLGFGQSELVIGIPDSWVDITSMSDLADLSMEFRENGKDLRIVTKYPRLVERFLLKSGLNYFSLVQSTGTLEAAPAMGYADAIADITSTGTTLRENQLKTIHGGSILKSEACLISNGTVVSKAPEKLQLAESLVERIEAHLRALELYSVTANMRGESPEDIAGYVLEHPDISGLQGPTISKVYTTNGETWYAVTVIVEKEKLLSSVKHFRDIGGGSVTVSRPNYLFQAESKALMRLNGTI